MVDTNHLSILKMQRISNKKFFVVCPTNVITGGPDALHQMSYYMAGQGFDCKMAYLADTKKGLTIPEPYKIYSNDFCLFKSVKDLEINHIIIPETFSFLAKKFKKAKVYIWWLSVDNNSVSFNWFKRLFYLASSPIRILKNKKLYHCSAFTKTMNTFFCHEYSFKNERENIVHLCASFYALDYVGERTTRQVYKCIEPISYVFLNMFKSDNTHFERNNIILFNPKKSSRIVERIKREYPFFIFEPLENMTQTQLVDAYKQAKLYIDFGPFPGAERIPKEAVLYGCLIITGRHGASNYFGDVPIPNEYKFESEEDLDTIVSKIKYCLNNYDACYHDFDEYRSTVLSLETNFIKSINSVFGSEE